MRWIFFYILFTTSTVSGQVKVDKAGDGWDLKVDSALSLIRAVDNSKYEVLIEVCDEIGFWVSEFSSNEITGQGIGRIYVATGDVKLNSINNLAAVLVHESLHLLFLKKNLNLPPSEEENLCYRYELEFLRKVSNVEPWLIGNTLSQIKRTQK